jgi:hypothetical protein
MLVRPSLFVTASRRLASGRITVTIVQMKPLVLTVLTFLSQSLSALADTSR